MKQKAITIHVLMGLLIAFCLIVPMAAPGPALTANMKTVRIGYYENAIFQEGAGEGAVKTGYIL